MKKAFSARIEEAATNRMKYYCSELGKSEADFIAEALEYYCDHIRHTRSGGLVLTVPNPQTATATKEAKKAAIEILSKTAYELTKNENSLEFGLHAISSFALERLNKDTDEQKKAFSESLGKDI